MSPPGVTEDAIRRITASKPSRPASYVREVRASCAGGLFLVLHPNITLGHDSVMYSLRYRSDLPQASFGAQLCQRPFLGSLRTLKYAPRLKRGAFAFCIRISPSGTTWVVIFPSLLGLRRA